MWQGADNTDNEIYYWNGSNTTAITNNSTTDALPQINDSGQLVWYGYDGTGYEIYFWNGSSTTKITNNTMLDISPQINNRGEVVWQQYDGNDYEIYYWNGTLVTQITNNTVNDYVPQINDSGQIVWYGSDGTYYEIFMATIPVTTSSTSTIFTTTIITTTTTTIIVDTDKDGVPDSQDNCPNKPNGPSLGTCSSTSDKPGINCTSDADCANGCSSNGLCIKDQEDADSDGKGDVCDNCPTNCNPAA